MTCQYQSSVLVIVVSIVMVVASHPAHADLGDQLFKLLADDGAGGDLFGWSVATSGDTAIVGATLDDDNGRDSGSAYLFDISDPANPTQLFKLLPDDGAAGDFFGESVAISRTTAIVGALLDNDNGSRSGSAYLFDITTGQQIAKLLPDDGAPVDHFGISVAISGATAIVGAYLDDDNGSNSGSAYLFDISDPANPVQVAKLLPDDGAAGDRFGWSVATSGETAIVGAYLNADNGANSGSAYVFDTATGAQIAKLLSDDGAAGDEFGQSVGISGPPGEEVAIVGAWRDDDNGTNSGSAYLFDTTTGQQISKLLANDGVDQDRFGASVAISGTTAIVGAYLDDDNGNLSGSAYLFDAATGAQIAKLLPDDGAAEDFFGRSVAISGTTAIVGAERDDDNDNESGSAYLFDAGGSTGTPATLTGLTMIDGFMVSGGLPELESSDDMYFSTLAFETGKASETHRLLYQVRALTTVQNPSTIDITLEGHILDLNVIGTLFLRNFDTGLFEEVGQFTQEFGTDTTTTVNVPNAARFVRRNGRIVLRVKKVIILPITIGEGFPSNDDLLEIMVR